MEIRDCDISGCCVSLAIRPFSIINLLSAVVRGFINYRGRERALKSDNMKFWSSKHRIRIII